MTGTGQDCAALAALVLDPPAEHPIACRLLEDSCTQSQQDGDQQQGKDFGESSFDLGKKRIQNIAIEGDMKYLRDYESCCPDQPYFPAGVELLRQVNSQKDRDGNHQQPVEKMSYGE
jgi:hypothetical protein